MNVVDEVKSTIIAKPYLLVVGVVALPFVVVLTFLVNQLLGALYRMTIGEWFSSWKHIPKVTTTDPLAFFFGDFRKIKAAAPGQQHVQWMDQLGPVYRYRHMFYVQRVLLADPKAMLHVLSPAKAYQYPKPEYTSAFLTAVLGAGLVSVSYTHLTLPTKA